MKDLQLKPEDIIIKIRVNKDITKKDVINNFIANLLVVGGDIANDITIILTKDTLYLEYKGHAELGYAEEIREIDKIELSNIKNIEVVSEDLEEFIKITTQNEVLSFVRDNSNKDNLALSLLEYVNSLK